MGESMNSLIELIDTVLQAKSICYENLLQEKLGADATIENNRLAIQELSEVSKYI